MNHVDIMQCMSENSRNKFSIVAHYLPGMSVASFNGIHYVDCGRESDTFNTVFGMPSCSQDIATITNYYRQRGLPAVWWLWGSSGEFCENFRRLDWIHEENEIGMYLDLNVQFIMSQSVFSHIEFCGSMKTFQDFGRVLGVVFEPGNPMGAENIRAIYHMMSDYREVIPDSLVQVVGTVMMSRFQRRQYICR